MTLNINEEIFEEVAEELSVSDIDDVLAGRASEETIRHCAGMAAAMLIKNEPLPEKYRIGLAYCLYHISKGTDPRMAFGLMVGHKRLNDKGEEMTIALSVLYAINNHKKSTEEAFKLTGLKLNKSPSTVREIYYRHKNEIETLIQKKTT